MNQLKKSMIPFLIIMAVVIFLFDFGDGEIEYKYVSYESLPNEEKRNFSEIGPGGSGMFRHNSHTYAFITTEPDEKVEIEFVGDAEDGIGKEVRYAVVKRATDEKVKVIDGMQGKFALYIIQLEKVVSPPFGFTQVNR